MFQEICTQEGNRYWSQLERPGINFRILSTRESERNDLSTATNHRRTVSCEESNAIRGIRLGAWEHGDGGTRVDKKLTTRVYILKKEEGENTKLWFRYRLRL